MKIMVLGAGAWGTALAASAAPRHDVTLWTRTAVHAGALRDARENVRYLPGIALPPGIVIRSDPLDGIDKLLIGQDLVVIASPMAGLRRLLEALRDCDAPVAWLCKGFEAAASDQVRQPGQIGLLGHEIRAQVAPLLRAGVLSGPSFAMEVARGQPAALVAACEHAFVRDAVVQAFHGGALRVYGNDDLVGVEVGGAVKNVLAIATGLCDGLGLGLNARAALITRGLAEMTRLGVALGGRAETFMGLSGLGDLVLTATGDLSRNRKVGLLLAQGNSLDQVIETLGHVAEGVYCARTVLERAGHLRIDMPIVEQVAAVLSGDLTASEAVAMLMGRKARSESQ